MIEFESLVLSLPGVWGREQCEELNELLVPAYTREIFVLDLRETLGLHYAILDALTEMEAFRVMLQRAHPTRVVITSRQLRRVFSVTRLDRTFEVYGSLPDALLASFKVAEKEAS